MMWLKKSLARFPIRLLCVAWVGVLGNQAIAQSQLVFYQGWLCALRDGTVSCFIREEEETLIEDLTGLGAIQGKVTGIALIGGYGRPNLLVSVEDTLHLVQFAPHLTHEPRHVVVQDAGKLPPRTREWRYFDYAHVIYALTDDGRMHINHVPDSGRWQRDTLQIPSQWSRLPFSPLESAIMDRDRICGVTRDRKIQCQQASERVRPRAGTFHDDDESKCRSNGVCTLDAERMGIPSEAIQSIGVREGLVFVLTVSGKVFYGGAGFSSVVPESVDLKPVENVTDPIVSMDSNATWARSLTGEYLEIRKLHSSFAPRWGVQRFAGPGYPVALMTVSPPGERRTCAIGLRGELHCRVNGNWDADPLDRVARALPLLPQRSAFEVLANARRQTQVDIYRGLIERHYVRAPALRFMIDFKGDYRDFYRDRNLSHFADADFYVRYVEPRGLSTPHWGDHSSPVIDLSPGMTDDDLAKLEIQDQYANESGMSQFGRICGDESPYCVKIELRGVTTESWAQAARRIVDRMVRNADELRDHYLGFRGAIGRCADFLSAPGPIVRVPGVCEN